MASVTRSTDMSAIALSLGQPRLNAPSVSSCMRPFTPALRVGPPPGTAAAWSASSSSRLVAPCSTARRMWATTPSSRPRNARIPMMTISRCLIDSSLPSPTDSSLTGCRAAAYCGSSRASQSAHGYPYGLLLISASSRQTHHLGPLRGAGRLGRAAPKARGGVGAISGPPRSKAHDLGGVLVDVLDASVRDGRRLHRGHQVAPAQRRPRGVELLVGRLVMLERVHLGEVVAARDPAEQGDQRLGRVTGVGILLGQRGGLLDLVGRAPRRE